MRCLFWVNPSGGWLTYITYGCRMLTNMSSHNTTVLRGIGCMDLLHFYHDAFLIARVEIESRSGGLAKYYQGRIKPIHG